jgi:predicted Rossmann-fold nucleotide-binding protein
VTRFPVVLLGTAYWSGLIDWLRHSMRADGYLNPADVELLTLTDDIDEAVRIVAAADTPQTEAPEDAGPRPGEPVEA